MVCYMPSTKKMYDCNDNIQLMFVDNKRFQNLKFNI